MEEGYLHVKIQLAFPIELIGCVKATAGTQFYFWTVKQIMLDNYHSPRQEPWSTPVHGQTDAFQCQAKQSALVVGFLLVGFVFFSEEIQAFLSNTKS